MEKFSALLAFCEGNSSAIGEFPAQRPVTRSFDLFFDLGLRQQLSKQWRRRWFETPWRSWWRHSNEDYLVSWKTNKRYRVVAVVFSPKSPRKTIFKLILFA